MERTEVGRTVRISLDGIICGPYRDLETDVVGIRTVRVRSVSGGRTAEVRELYLGRHGGRRLFIPAAEQPTQVETTAIVSGDSDELEVVRLPILPGQPTVFEEVTVISTES